ncbi:SDR family NAD(P)-dependent oxidoreductase [Nocardia sp. NPDC101769]|uniref:SDR family NAD(P)-dependent oxidoreductase n=1 Tax=Nocardia sp. NPDC101769 TaxID=3364333 RepID=UPI00381CCE85
MRPGRGGGGCPFIGGDASSKRTETVRFEINWKKSPDERLYRPVVGGTSGIGLATARRLRARGATVHIVGRSKQRLGEVAATDPGLIGHQADGSDSEAIAAVAAQIGTIDWLVVTLAGSEGVGPIADLDLGMLRNAFDAKFWGHITTVQAVVPHLAPADSITVSGCATDRAPAVAKK